MAEGLDPVIYGRHPVLESLRAGGPIQRIHMVKDAVGLPRELFELAKRWGLPVVRTDKERLDGLSRGGNHQGVVAVLGARLIPTFTEWRQALLEAQATVVLALDQVQDPQNLGALLRTAEGAGCHDVLLSAERSCGLTSTVSRVSAGADQHLRLGRTEKMGVALETLRGDGFQIIASTPSSEELYYDVDYRGPTVILLGGEERGLPPHLKRVSSRVVRLPMLGKLQSLNVASSGAILLYELVRQRGLD